MKQYNVNGMSCAACSSRVEKAVSKVEGVTSCSVSLLTNSMGVEGDAKEADILAAVEKAGYSASVKGENTAKRTEHAEEEFLKDKETPVLKKRLILSFVFPCAADVSFDGTYDVELAASRDSGRESCGNGNFTALADRMCDDHQSEVFCQWISKSAARRAEYGYAGGVGSRRFFWI